MIIVRIWEGLGNQLFQYAFARVLQIKTQERVYLDTKGCNGKIINPKHTKREYQLSNFRIKMREYNDVDKYYFFLDESNFVKKGIKNLSQQGLFPYKYVEESNVMYKPEFWELTGHYYIQGWFQNEKYFKEYEDIIRKEIRLKERIMLETELADNLKKKNTVAIHIRRGDFKKDFNVLSKEYYETAIEYISRKLDKPFFCIFSDELDWVKNNMKLPNDCYFVNENHVLKDYEELIVMSHCKHQIIANSTYSWWGAWLNNNKDKMVIGPKMWFPPRCNNAGLNIMPNGWIRL